MGCLGGDTNQPSLGGPHWEASLSHSPLVVGPQPPTTLTVTPGPRRGAWSPTDPQTSEQAGPWGLLGWGDLGPQGACTPHRHQEYLLTMRQALNRAAGEGEEKHSRVRQGWQDRSESKREVTEKLPRALMGPKVWAGDCGPEESPEAPLGGANKQGSGACLCPALRPPRCCAS